MKARGTGSLFRRGRVWWIQYSFRGAIHRESSRSTIKGDAILLLKRRHGEMGSGRLVGPDAERVTFDDLAKMLEDDYRVNGRKSLDRALRSVVHLRVFFGMDRAIDITPDRVNAYIRSRLDEKPPVKPATIRLELAALGLVNFVGARSCTYEPTSSVAIAAGAPRSAACVFRWNSWGNWRPPSGRFALPRTNAIRARMRALVADSCVTQPRALKKPAIWWRTVAENRLGIWEEDTCDFLAALAERARATHFQGAILPA